MRLFKEILNDWLWPPTTSHIKVSQRCLLRVDPKRSSIVLLTAEKMSPELTSKT